VDLDRPTAAGRSISRLFRGRRTFDDSNLAGASFANVHLQQSQLTKVDLSGVTLEHFPT